MPSAWCAACRWRRDRVERDDFEWCRGVRGGKRHDCASFARKLPAADEEGKKA